ncbi:HpcH/HpaI aldolase family protein [Bauldia sp.]|uniref:HpcH/HpaI aldolase family protein n=1 Tax=Bauldia sp. TaxID=2575872 RepID=UPI003BACB077
MATFSEQTRTKDPKLGTYVGEFTTAGIGRLLKASGCDFAFVDMEHNGWSYETAKAVLRSLHDTGVATVLRPPSQATHHLARACDIGAQGVIPPMLSTVAQAEAGIAAIKYPPEGQRGCAFGIAHDDYAPEPVIDAMAAANAKTSFVALIETAEGVANSAAIAAHPGVDCLWIGHLDLSASLGIPGAFDSPVFLSAIDQVMAAARDNGKSVGRLVASAEEAKAFNAAGCDFLCYLGDVWLLQKALRDGFADIRATISG